jgi:hypothetical protein
VHRKGSRGLHKVLTGIANDFMAINVDKHETGCRYYREIFVRDNAVATAIWQTGLKIWELRWL